MLRKLGFAYFIFCCVFLLGSCSGSGEPSSSTGSNFGNEEYIETENPDSESCLETSCFYFSYDDSASTAAAEIVKYSVLNDIVPDNALGRAYEFLNYEKFDNSNQTNIGLFDVSMGVWTHSGESESSPLIHELGIHLSSPVISKEERKNTVLTILVDVSGSMSTNFLNLPIDVEPGIKTRLDVVKYGLSALYKEGLKEGDVINIVQFESNSTKEDILLEAWSYSEADSKFSDTVSSLITLGSTNLDAGITRAYEVATRNYDSNKVNRVVILTDAFANTGETDPAIISQNTSINNQEGIYFSGIGVGVGFNDAFLDELTDAGKGAYFSVITPRDSARVFTDKFVSLLNIAAINVQFRLDYPPELTHVSTASEEQSSNKSEVQTTNFSYNTSQYFLEGFEAPSSDDALSTPIKLTITYENSQGDEFTEIHSMALEDIEGFDLNNIKDAYLISTLANLVAEKKTCEAATSEIDTLLSAYESELATEYRDLIVKFCNK